MAKEQIEHKGIIKKITESEIVVSIISHSACTKCNLKSACSVSEVEEKLIYISKENPENFTEGESVNVFYSQSLGFRALFLGYILPFLIVLTSLIVMISITEKEGLSGLISIAVLVPYYFILYLSKDKIKKTFSFSIKK